jgi:GNAT superfamily N-acetyltransferase
MDGEYPELDFVIRTLTLDDLSSLVRIDRQITGRSRHAWYEGKLERALQGSDVQISLGAERRGLLIGAMLGSLHYGEFGGQGVATALLEQLVKNLHALRIERLRTEVAWDDHELMAFFGKKGFVPIPRLVLEADVTAMARE